MLPAESVKVETIDEVVAETDEIVRTAATIVSPAAPTVKANARVVPFVWLCALLDTEGLNA